MIANYQRIQDVDAHQLRGSNGHLECMLHMLQLVYPFPCHLFTSLAKVFTDVICQNVHRCFSLCDFQTAPPSATLAVWVPKPSLANPASYVPSLANQASYPVQSWSKPRLPIDDVLRGQTLSLNNRPSCYPSRKKCEHLH